MSTTRTTSTAGERALVAAAQAGDERAFRALVEPYRGVLEVHCYRMLGSRHDAEDLVQETLLRAWRALDRFERRAAVSTWLYRIATNACLDEIERRPRRAAVVAIDPFPDERLAQAALVAPVVDPAARYAIREGMELALLTAIQRLPGRQRAILILRDVLGWTAPEVADLLDTTVAAANGALQRARATIEAVVPARTLASDRPRSPERALLTRYIDAWERQDIDGLVALLREDAVLDMPPQPALRGAAAIRAFWLTPPCGLPERRTLRPAAANGLPAVAFFEPDGRPHRLLVLEADASGTRLATLRAYAEPQLAAFVAGQPEDLARTDRTPLSQIP
jgi:RNA polymerase sigma-70 factor (ECF subfamily)